MPYLFNPFTGNLDETVPLSGGVIPSQYLPSYVDDVLEYANLAALPATGESGKIYVTLDSGNSYRWSGSAYTLVASPSAASSVDSLDDLADVDLSTAAPTSNQSLAWNGTTFVPKTVVLSSTTGITGSSVITNCVRLTQANYDLIASPDPNTLYVILP